ncbi:sigma-54-dependent transcriptional regulator [Caldinitratiruptor microaerophilus]|uniref:Stage 0 sporulation protein A homolog n=1 Tax=Caldinitratiruptor microaerophilus TaxID=671077 RepID=A0AA35G8H4_9FIRM|nr:sigma-54 dependent transcriptional regulator [Caldinitratiruptor microaerophilus]BDG61071.1 sigma-54-dependent Fis family transcriptional regulator [Caldinitratiruptor microaerophilus]
MADEPRVLIADDEDAFRELLVQRMQRRGWRPVGAADGHEALAALAEQEFDLAVVDIRMPGPDGLEVLRRAREMQPALEVVILTGHGTIETAIQAMKEGAYDFLTKPCNLSELDLVLQKALERRRLADENTGLRAALWRQEQVEIVGESPAIRQLLELTRRVAAADSNVLIEGESGTGKELVARALHRWSGRARGPFLAVNAAALPAHLLESELFGHARGAFTGAAADKPGLVELGHRGTLFLDEVGEMPAELQPKLLRFAETGEFRRVGETRLRRVSVRIVSATNRRLADEVAAGRFREDLYYRLCVVRIEVPPLRERREDIPLLVDHFLRRRARGPRSLSPAALDALMRYHYPGNVRELFNIVERGAILASGEVIQEGDLLLPGAVRLAERPAGGAPVPGPTAGDRFPTLEEVEREHIRRALERTGWNRAQAARLLGVSVRNLYRKIDEYRLSPGA